MSQTHQSAVRPPLTVPRWEPKPGVPLEPLPPRSRFWLWIQLWFQWVYLIPLGVLALVVLALDLLSDGGLGMPGEVLVTSIMRPLWPRQYRLETGRDPAAWYENARAALAKRGDPAEYGERRERAAALEKEAAKPNGWAARHPRSPVQPSITLPVTVYRGLGLAGLAELAGGTGWAIDWKQSRKPLKRVTLLYVREL